MKIDGSGTLGFLLDKGHLIFPIAFTILAIAIALFMIFC